MKNIMKKGACVTLIYLIAIACTFIMANRVERLEGAKMESESLLLSALIVK